MTQRELEILQLIKENPLITQEELAYSLGITRSGVATHIHNLSKKGYIKGRGYLVNERNFVTVIGGINMDIMGIPSGNLIANNSNPGKIQFTLGGAGRNISMTLTRLKVPNYLVSVYGDDMNGEKFIKNSMENNMDIQCCEKINDQNTSSFLYIDNIDGSKVMGIDDMAIYNHMTPDFLLRYMDKVNNSQYCVIDTNLPAETIEYIYQNVTTPTIVKTISINKNNRLISPDQNIYLLVTSPRELKELLLAYDEPYINTGKAVDFLLNKNIENIIVFTINDGIYFKNRSEKIYLKEIPEKIKHISGASAVLTGVVIWGLQNNLDWKKLLRLAYSAIFISLESIEPVNPVLSISKMMDVEKEIFEKH
ncbi:PfkB family carbohydrate kinase [Enterococcus raffinosus]|uniref:PfkB family carbohydrate kinase n=1 Tax=Enterococcus raffinosus TaxID=71452 RepID=UPI00288E91AE|nr:PfkB family carbohydrate kinase [Enterococcus raffinosus]MDT2556635.1 PfkB family carbohydrate kinase [Enterococcus raffinosus]